MFVKQVTVLCNILVVEIRDPEIQENIQQEREVEYNEIFSVCSVAHFILHVRFNPKNPERFDQEIEKKKNNKVGDEFLLHAETK